MSLNPPCMNPDHLRPGTRAENVWDMHSKGRSPHQAEAGGANVKCDRCGRFRKASDDEHHSGCARDEQKPVTERCDGCGRFSKGPFIGIDDDHSKPSARGRVAWVGPCCQTPADRATFPLTEEGDRA